MILDPIIEDERGDSKAEPKKGKLFCALLEEANISKVVIKEEETEKDHIHS